MVSGPGIRSREAQQSRSFVTGDFWSSYHVGRDRGPTLMPGKLHHDTKRRRFPLRAHPYYYGGHS